MKVMPPLKVKDMEFIEGCLSLRKLKRNHAICSTGRPNYYRITFLKGQGGSTKEETWDKKKHVHTCCKSAVAWRHRVSCKRLLY